MPSTSLPGVREVVGFTPARTLRDFRNLLADESVPVVRSRKQFDALLADEKRNPLRSLDDATVKMFVDSCCFGDRGFCGFNYGPIQDKLSFYDFRVLIGHFGLDWSVFEDFQDEKCSPPNCVTAKTSICIGDNCK